MSERKEDAIRTGCPACRAVATVTVGALLAGCSLLGLGGLDNGEAQGDAQGDADFSALDSSRATDEGQATDEGGLQGVALEGGPDARRTVDGKGDTEPGPSDAGIPVDRNLDTNSQDGGVPSESGSGADASVGAPDVGIDPGTDAASNRDAPATGTWCATHSSAITFDCHDFDEGLPAPTGFTNHYYSGRYSTVTSTEFAAGSAPSALLVTTPSLATGAAPQNDQFNDLVPFNGKLTLAFAFKIVNYDVNAPDVSLFRISYQDGTWAASLDFQQRGAIVFAQAVPPDGGMQRATYPAVQPSSLDAWTNVDCSLDFKKHTLSLSYNGIAILSNQVIENPAGTSPAIFVQVGLNYLAAPAKPMMIYYDNILLNLPP